jgi:hypothetical protein
MFGVWLPTETTWPFRMAELPCTLVAARFVITETCGGRVVKESDDAAQATPAELEAEAAK